MTTSAAQAPAVGDAAPECSQLPRAVRVAYLPDRSVRWLMFVGLPQRFPKLP